LSQASLSPRLPNRTQFLRLIVEATEAGRADQLKESLIGVAVFNIMNFEFGRGVCCPTKAGTSLLRAMPACGYQSEAH
jgi:hypothetical protein